MQLAYTCIILSCRLRFAKHEVVLRAGNLRRQGHQAYDEQRGRTVQAYSHRPPHEHPNYWGK